jgi:hypothetical protein
MSYDVIVVQSFLKAESPVSKGCPERQYLVDVADLHEYIPCQN